MATKTEPPEAERGTGIREPGRATSGWVDWLGPAGFASSALGLLLNVALWVFVVPGGSKQTAEELYGSGVWDGPNWIMYLYIGMAVSAVLGVAGIVLAKRSADYWDSGAPGKVPVLASVALFVILLMDAWLFCGANMHL